MFHSTSHRPAGPSPQPRPTPHELPNPDAARAGRRRRRAQGAAAAAANAGDRHRRRRRAQEATCPTLPPPPFGLTVALSRRHAGGRRRRLGRAQGATCPPWPPSGQAAVVDAPRTSPPPSSLGALGPPCLAGRFEAAVVAASPRRGGRLDRCRRRAQLIHREAASPPAPPLSCRREPMPAALTLPPRFYSLISLIVLIRLPTLGPLFGQLLTIFRRNSSKL
ncbi:hypothetical protein ACP4OV_028475 [Aristida adscensionis]